MMDDTIKTRVRKSKHKIDDSCTVTADYFVKLMDKMKLPEFQLLQ